MRIWAAWPTIARGGQPAQDKGEGTTTDSRFNRHADRLVERHGERVWRLGIDGGFGCPNRAPGGQAGAGRGPGGCVYCSPSAARAPYLEPLALGDPDTGGAGILGSIALQARTAMAFARRRYGARLFFPYFQAFSSTHAPVGLLEARYDAAIAAVEAEEPGSVRGLVVSTRPDCVDDAVAGLLARYAGRGLEVWVELGLQSGVDATLTRIRRGHTVADFVRACGVLGRQGIRVAAHLILGLPGEDRAAMLAGPRIVSELGLAGVKFHDLHVPRGSALAGEFLSGELGLLSMETYLGVLADAVELLDPSTEILRLETDSPGAERLAPRRAFDKRKLYERLEGELGRRGTRQGSLYRAKKPRGAPAGDSADPPDAL